GSARFVRNGAHREPADVRAGTWRRGLRCSGGAKDRARGSQGRLQVFGGAGWYCEQRSVPDAAGGEELGGMMFLTKKAIPRRTLLKSARGALALPLLEAMI